MQENCRLGNFCLLQLLIGTVEHDLGYVVTKNIISFLEKFLCQRIVVVQVFTHTYELRSLSGKNKCFHINKKFNIRYLACKVSTFSPYMQTMSHIIKKIVANFILDMSIC